MKKILTATIIAIALYAPLGANAVTPMELRVMQTREFATDPQTVAMAIIEMCRDNDLTASGRLSRGGLVCVGTNVKKGTIAQLMFSTKPGTDLEDTETLVRIRSTPRGDYGALGMQIKNPRHYSMLFDQVGQYLFMNAIPWEPPTQH
jgi:hypothetical protein